MLDIYDVIWLHFAPTWTFSLCCKLFLSTQCMGQLLYVETKCEFVLGRNDLMDDVLFLQEFHHVIVCSPYWCFRRQLRWPYQRRPQVSVVMDTCMYNFCLKVLLFKYNKAPVYLLASRIYVCPSVCLLDLCIPLPNHMLMYLANKEACKYIILWICCIIVNMSQYYTIIDWWLGQHMICWTWRQNVARGRRPYVFICPRSNIDFYMPAASNINYRDYIERNL